MQENLGDLKIQNPKFKFSEAQTRDIMMAAYHLSKAAEHLMETNGMLGLVYNAQSIELLDQAGLSQIFLDELGYTKTVESQIQLSEEERKEVDDLFDELMGSDNEKKESKKTEWNGTLGDSKLDQMFKDLMEPSSKTLSCGQNVIKPSSSSSDSDSDKELASSDTDKAHSEGELGSSDNAEDTKVLNNAHSDRELASSDNDNAHSDRELASSDNDNAHSDRECGNVHSIKECGNAEEPHSDRELASSQDNHSSGDSDEAHSDREFNSAEDTKVLNNAHSDRELASSDNVSATGEIKNSKKSKRRKTKKKGAKD